MNIFTSNVFLLIVSFTSFFFRIGKKTNMKIITNSFVAENMLWPNRLGLLNTPTASLQRGKKPPPPP